MRIIFRIFGKIIGWGSLLLVIWVVGSVVLGIGSGIVNMPDEDGGPSIKENWQEYAKPMIVASWTEDIYEEKPYRAKYAGTYYVSGVVSYAGEKYVLQENGVAEWYWVKENGGNWTQEFKGKGTWRCLENIIFTNIYDNDAVIAEKYTYTDGIWEELVGNRQMKRK